MEREGAEPVTKRARPAYTRYFFSDGPGFILSLPPDIRRLVTSERYWTPFDRLMVTMAHFEYGQGVLHEEVFAKAIVQSASHGSYEQFEHFVKKKIGWNVRLNCVALPSLVAKGGDVKKMQLLEKVLKDDDHINLDPHDLRRIAAFHGKVEMMQFLTSWNTAGVFFSIQLPRSAACRDGWSYQRLQGMLD